MKHITLEMLTTFATKFAAKIETLFAKKTDIPKSLPASDVSAWAKSPTKPKYTASEVGADASGAANTALASAKSYTDTKVSALINGAPETLDTLKEVADAIEENATVVDALNSAIGSKANSSDLTSHTGNADVHLSPTQKTNYDSAYTHSKAAHAPTGAEKNTIVTIKKNGTVLTPDASRAVNVTVPTKTSELSNDSGFKTTDTNTTYSLKVAANSATNGNAKLRLSGSNSTTNDVLVKGSGSVSVTTDASGNIIVAGTSAESATDADIDNIINGLFS